SEYTNPSTPPKKYRKQTLSGGAGICVFSNNVCSGDVSGPNQRRDVYSGEYTYSGDDCNQNNTQLCTRYSGTVGDAGCPPLATRTVPAGTFPSLSASDPFANSVDTNRVTEVIISSTLKELQTISACNGATFAVTGQGMAQAVLSEEDTEADAMDRAVK